MDFLLDFILHIDQYMIDIVQEYHMWAYAILFLLIVAIIVVSILPALSLIHISEPTRPY